MHQDVNAAIVSDDLVHSGLNRGLGSDSSSMALKLTSCSFANRRKSAIALVHLGSCLCNDTSDGAYCQQIGYSSKAEFTVTHLANPLRYSAVPLSHNERLVPFGADRPEWQTRQKRPLR